jgi:ubiquinone/menaquinone biosynthesis C-methylase UbiE
MDAERQRQLILDQFTKQALPFSRMPAHANNDDLRLIIETAGLGPDDNVLDVACGPGLVTCAVAKVVRHVTGLDLTPAMIEQAQHRQRSAGLTNMTWELGDVMSLPFPDATFSAVVTRYSFHHFLDPQAVLAEMVRVCQPGGKLCVVDIITSSPEQAAAYDHFQKLRDPSHVRGLSLEELTALFYEAGIRDMGTVLYKSELELEKSLAASFPNPGDAEVIRQMFRDDLGVDRMGLGVEERDGALYFAYTVAIVTGTNL